MKKYIISLIITTLTLILLLVVSSNKLALSATSTNNEELDEYQKAVLETAFAYYYRGKSIQYDSMYLIYKSGANAIRRNNLVISGQNYNKNLLYSPEEATIYDVHYIVCSHFAASVYADAFLDSKKEKYVLHKKNDSLVFTTSNISEIGNPSKTQTYKKEVSVLYKKETDDYKFDEHFDDLLDEVLSKIEVGDIFLTGQHAMLYIGEINGVKTLIHSTGGAPAAYTKYAKSLNSNISSTTAKYHLESKLDFIESKTGTLTEDGTNDTEGSIKFKNLVDRLRSDYGSKSNSLRELVIIRPLNEIRDKKNGYTLSDNANQRINTPGLKATKYTTTSASNSKFTSANISSEIVYSIVIANNSDIKRTGQTYSKITITDELPKNTTLSSISSNGKNNNGKLTWDIKNLAPGKSVKVSYTVTINDDINLLGQYITSDKTYVHGYTSSGEQLSGIQLKVIKTPVNRTLYTSDRKKLKEKALSLENKEYNNTETFINDVYKSINKPINIISAESIFNNLFKKETTKVTTVISKNYALEPEGEKRNVFTLLKPENVNDNYKYIMNMYIKDLFGGLYTLSQNETTLSYSRNTTYNQKTLLIGDIIAVYDRNYINDDISKKGGYISGEYNLYLYIGSREFATVRNNKVYIYKSTDNYDFTVYTPDRNIEKTINTTNLGTITIGDRLLMSLIGQNSFIILRPSYNLKYNITNIKITTPPTKKDYIQNFEELNLSGGKLQLTYGSHGNKTINLNDPNVKITSFDNSKLGKTTATIEYEGLSTTLEVNIVNKSISSISISEKPKKIKYIQNSENIDLSNGKLKIAYNDKTTSIIDLNTQDIKISGFNNTKLGTNKITVSYGKYTTSFNVTIVPKEIENITLINYPYKLNYIEGKDNLDLTGAIISVDYNDNTKEEISLPNDKIKYSGFDNQVGIKTITLTYENKEDSFNVNVISKSISKIEIIKKPSKIKYISKKEKLDLSGGKLLITYNNDTTEEMSLTSPNITINKVDLIKIGTKQVVVNYKENSTSFNIEVINEDTKTLKKIEINTLPTKKTYAQGKEKLDLSGGTIKAYYSDNTTEIINLTSKNITTSGFNNSITGKCTITVTYLSKQTTFDIKIEKKEIKKIVIVQEPNKKEYEKGDKIDLEGGKIEIQYSDNSKEQIDLKSQNIKTQKDTIDIEKGSDTIVVSYNNKETSFIVKINQRFTELFELDTLDDDSISISDFNQIISTIKNKKLDSIINIIIIVLIGIIIFLITKICIFKFKKTKGHS